MRAAKDLHFNKNMEALKKMQAGADKLATVVGVTLGPKVRQPDSTMAQGSRQKASSERFQHVSPAEGLHVYWGECSRTTQRTIDTQLCSPLVHLLPWMCCTMHAARPALTPFTTHTHT